MQTATEGQATAVDGSAAAVCRGTDVRGVVVCIGGACQLQQDFDQKCTHQGRKRGVRWKTRA